jgi:hypothetical protein
MYKNRWGLIRGASWLRHGDSREIPRKRTDSVRVLFLPFYPLPIARAPVLALEPFASGSAC